LVFPLDAELLNRHVKIDRKSAQLWPAYIARPLSSHLSRLPALPVTATFTLIGRSNGIYLDLAVGIGGNPAVVAQAGKGWGATCEAVSSCYVGIEVCMNGVEKDGASAIVWWCIGKRGWKFSGVVGLAGIQMFCYGTV
jgi:hypothetical protein